jgi:hypothetical protein
MRILALALAFAAAAATSAAEVKIVRVYTGWREAASFKRISEYFSGRENTGGEIVVRSRPEERGGYYFLVRTANAGAARPVRFLLHVVTPDATQPRLFRFSSTLPAGQAVHQLGLTGTDWPDRTVDAMAWKLEIADAAGTELLAEAKSYLWEKPAGK